MMHRVSGIGLAACLCALVACAQSSGEISQDSDPFDGIGAEAAITALGTEPFWGLDIEPTAQGFTARFSSPDDIDGSEFPVERFAGNNGLGFNGQLGDREVQVALTPGDCSDGMSDRSYPYTATIALGDATLFGCAYTSDEPFTGDETP